MVSNQIQKKVWLAGGLGNQLFQLAFAQFLSIKYHEEVYLDYTHSSPRLNLDSNPEVTSLIFPDGINLCKDPSGGFQTKVLNYCLRENLRLREKPCMSAKSLIVKAISLAFGGWHQRYAFSRDLGFDEIENQSDYDYFVGYFQTYRYISEISPLHEFWRLRESAHRTSLAEYREAAAKDKPLIIHVRLTDYLTNPTFGHLTLEYYRSALQWHKNNSDFNCIWVFSDDIAAAVKFLDIQFDIKVSWFQDVENSSALTLAIMTLGSGYIIPNSTFSWWAAYCRESPTAKVVAPLRWFSNGDEPNHLIPIEWKRL